MSDLFKKIASWFKPVERPTTHVSITSNNGVIIREQRGPVNINGSIYNEGDPLPEGVDITWVR